MLNEKIDIVIMTYKPKDDLIIALEKLLNQKHMPENIIIYNTNESLFYINITDREKLDNILKNNNISVFHIDENEFDHGDSRNKAFDKTKSEFVMFMTDDAVPYDENLLTNILVPFSEQNVATTYARQIAKAVAPLKEKYVREFNYKDFDIVKDKSTEFKYGIKNCFCSNVCAVYRRKIFLEIGGFSKNLIQNEDMLYAYNAIEKGYKVVYKADAKIIHSHNMSYIEQYNRNFDIGVFQKMHIDIYKKYKTISEGKSLVKYVVNKLLSKGHILEAMDFIVECFYRYMGFKSGLSFDRLDNATCIKKANNKKFFIKGKVI